MQWMMNESDEDADCLMEASVLREVYEANIQSQKMILDAGKYSRGRGYRLTEKYVI